MFLPIILSALMPNANIPQEETEAQRNVAMGLAFTA